MIRDLVALTKPGIVRMVTLTAAVGFAVHVEEPKWWGVLPWLLLGTALVAGGTNALNQWWERHIDARMVRTAGRPLPAGRLASGPALAWATGLAVGGLLMLLARTNVLTAGLALATLVSYVVVYTPLKTRTPHATLVGAVPGALPIVGGWTAAGGGLDAGAAVLFAVMFLWQIPHFLALGHLYAEDYRRGGIRLLGAGDPRAAGRQAFLYAVMLVWASMLPVGLGAGRVYVLVAGLSGLCLAVLAWRFAAAASQPAARRLFLGSLAYLPVVLFVLVIDIRF